MKVCNLILSIPYWRFDQSKFLSLPFPCQELWLEPCTVSEFPYGINVENEPQISRSLFCRAKKPEAWWEVSICSEKAYAKGLESRL
jgi:hypothetical protein